jgi:hypothetical protein
MIPQISYRTARFHHAYRFEKRARRPGNILTSLLLQKCGAQDLACLLCFALPTKLIEPKPLPLLFSPGSPMGSDPDVRHAIISDLFCETRNSRYPFTNVVTSRTEAVKPSRCEARYGRCTDGRSV